MWLQDQDPILQGYRPLVYLPHQLLVLHAVPLCPQTAISPLPQVHCQHFLWLLQRATYASIQLPSWPSCLSSFPPFLLMHGDQVELSVHSLPEFLPGALQGRYFQKGEVKIALLSDISRVGQRKLSNMAKSAKQINYGLY